MVVQGRDEAAEASALIDAWIEPDPYRSGAADVRIREYGVHIWALIGHLLGVDGDVDQVAQDYVIPVDAVRAAQAFYARHTTIIDARIAANAT